MIKVIIYAHGKKDRIKRNILLWMSSDADCKISRT